MKVIVTRHTGAVEWLRNHGVEGPVLDRGGLRASRSAHGVPSVSRLKTGSVSDAVHSFIACRD